MKATPQELYATTAKGRMSKAEYDTLRAQAISLAEGLSPAPKGVVPFLTDDMLQRLVDNDGRKGSRKGVRKS